jgi:hypothetical protein
MNTTETQPVMETAGTSRLMIANIPYKADKALFVKTLAGYGKIYEAYLSPPKTADRNNEGWAIIVVDEKTAKKLLADDTILILDRIVRITRARPKTE